MNQFLSIENMSCGYGEKFRVKNISFSLPQGTFAGIIGPNGSGKTTLFRGLTTEIPLFEGTIKIEHKPIHQLKHKERAQKIAVVSQQIEVSDITVGEYVLMGRMPYHSRLSFFESDDDLQIAQKYMEFTGVYHLKDKLINQLSGGEQQLAAIARALTQEPALLLLDEPTSHLDIGHQVQVLSLLQRLYKELNITILMIIHDLNMAGEYCDYLVLMNRGEVHFQGTPEEVLDFKNIEEVYHTVVVQQTNPISGKPVIFSVSENYLKEFAKK